MNERDAFLAKIFAEPDDDIARLVYADWLDEHGDPTRAEFIRVQCRLARIGQREYSPVDDSDRELIAEVELLRHREQELFRTNLDLWIAGLPGADARDTLHIREDACEVVAFYDTDYDTDYTFRRGFPEISQGLPLGSLTKGQHIWLVLNQWNEERYDLTRPVASSDQPYGTTFSGVCPDAMVQIMIQRMGGAISQVPAYQFIRSPQEVPTVG